MRENRPYGSEGGVGESRSRPLSYAVSSRFGTGVDAFFNYKGQGLWVPARGPGRHVERSRFYAAPRLPIGTIGGLALRPSTWKPATRL
jgi:hypothetical protein